MQADPTSVVNEVRTLVERLYPDADVAARVSAVLGAALTADAYPTDVKALAAAVTTDLQSVNGDQHLRLLFHETRLPEREPGSDAEEYAAMLDWARRTGRGVAQARLLAGNIGHLDLQPVIFPTVIGAGAIAAAMDLLADIEVLILDLRKCIGGEPSAVAFVISYLWDEEPTQVTGLRQRREGIRQSWTLGYVPGRRFGKAKPVYVLTSAATFSGGEAVAYDLQQLGRATLVGEPTRGGAHPREKLPSAPPP